jgi:hypothetical protein
VQTFYSYVQVKDTSLHDFVKIFWSAEITPFVTVTYIALITSILGRLAFIPVGDHETMPALMSKRKSELFEHGKCDENWHPGSGSNTSTHGLCTGPPTMPSSP